MPKKFTNEEFLERVKNNYGDLFIFLENYINAKTKIKAKCNNNHIFMVYPGKLTGKNRLKNCHVCYNENKKKKEILY